jgi:DNA mismatch endonuclease (patch repair protein)
MVDIVSPAKRSSMMRNIKGKNTAPELALRKALYAEGHRYRLHDDALPGKPDLVFRKIKTVVFVHGCFWHRHHGCKYATLPQNNAEFWKDKFSKNVDRDRKVSESLYKLGWNIIVVWECELKSISRLKDACLSISEQLHRIKENIKTI